MDRLGAPPGIAQQGGGCGGQIGRLGGAQHRGRDSRRCPRHRGEQRKDEI
jgi:hypothetical protein